MAFANISNVICFSVGAQQIPNRLLPNMFIFYQLDTIHGGFFPQSLGNSAMLPNV